MSFFCVKTIEVIVIAVIFIHVIICTTYNCVFFKFGEHKTRIQTDFFSLYFLACVLLLGKDS